MQAISRVVVIPIAIDVYDEPKGGKANRASAFDELPAVRTDLALLQALFGSPLFRDHGFEIADPIGGSALDILAGLSRWKDELQGQEGVSALVFWSGHGRTVDSELRLVTRECFDPVLASDGLSPTQVVGPLADAGLKALFVLLDVCQAGAASADLIIAAARRARNRTPEHPLAFGALLSAYPYEQAPDGVFVPQLERLLREGPSAEARAWIAREGGRIFGVDDRMLSLQQVQDALAVELDLLRATRPSVPTPTGVHMADRSPYLFPNSCWVWRAPPRNVEESRIRLLQGDVKDHFLPKARGLEPGEKGWFFSGRAEVTREIVAWLDAGEGAAPNDRLFVLCGDGGTGKSAVVGRLITLSDAVWRDQARALGWNEGADRASGLLPQKADWLDAALHLRRHTVEQAAVALAELLGLQVGGRAALIESAVSWPTKCPHPPTVVLDALDEADEPGRIALDLVRPLTEAGWRILVATRRRAAHAGAADLVSLLQPSRKVDLDVDPETDADIAGYVVRRLETAAIPYIASEARIIGDAVAERAVRKFLYARIAVGGLLRRKGPPLPASKIGEWLAVDLYHALERELATLDQAFKKDFERSDAGASAMLAALAWAEGEGLPLRDALWAAAAEGFGQVPIESTHVLWMLREGGRFIVESGDGEQAVYRLYHQSWADHFRNAPGHQEQARRVALALAAQRSSEVAWSVENPYLVRHLAAHLALLPDASRLQALLMNPHWTLARMAFGGVAGLLSEHERCVDPPPTLRSIGDALRRSAHQLAADPEQLAAQMLARLLGDRRPGVEAFLTALTARRRGAWLRPVTPSLAGERSIRSVRGEGDRSLDSVALSRDGRSAIYARDQDVFRIDLQGWISRGVTFRAPSHPYALALSGDASACLAADSSGGLYVCRQEGSENLAGVHEDDSIARFLGLGADGRYGLSASASRRRNLFAWDFQNHRHKELTRVANDVPTALALDPTGRHGVVGCSDGTVQMLQTWPLVLGARFQVTGQPLAIDQAPDLTMVAVGGSDHVIEARRTSDLQHHVMRETLTEQPRCVALSDDAQLLAVGTEAGSVEVWEVASSTRCASYPRAHTYEVLQIAFVAGGEHVVSADLLHVKQWDSRSTEVTAPPLPVKGDIVASPALGRVFGMLEEGRLGRWDLSTGEALPACAATSVKVTAWKGIGLAAGAPCVMAWGEKGLAAWDLDAGTLLIEGDAEALKAAAISHDGRFVIGADGRNVRAWRCGGASATMVGQYPSFDTPRSVAITSDGTRVLTAGGDRWAHVWSTQRTSVSGKEVATWSARTRNKPAMVVCIADDQAVIVTSDGELMTIDPRSDGFELAPVLDDRHRSSLTALLSFGDGDRFATSSHDGTVRLWSLIAGGCTHVFQSEQVGEPMSLHQLAPVSGRMLVSTFAGVLKVLSLEDGSTIARFQADKQIVSAAGDEELLSVAAVDQGGGLHFLRLELL